MARGLRFDFPGAQHHVMNRGAAHGDVFRDDEDRSLFLDVLGQAQDRHGVRIQGYSLLDNHYHLLLSTPRANLSRFMRDLGANYTQWHNRRHGLDGPLFRGRFHSRLAMYDSYWAHLLFYVHNNPVEAGLCRSLDRAKWTSHRAYVGLDEAPKWLSMGEQLALHGGVEGYLSYVADQEAGRGKLPEGWDADQLWAPHDMDNIRMLDPREPATPDAPQGMAALELIREVTGYDAEQLVAAVRGRRGNPARRVACWWLANREGVLPMRVAEHLGVHQSRVSRMIRQVEADLGTGNQVDIWVKALESRRKK